MVHLRAEITKNRSVLLDYSFIVTSDITLEFNTLSFISSGTATF